MKAQTVGIAAWIGLGALFLLWPLLVSPRPTGSDWIGPGLMVIVLLLPACALRQSTQRALLWVGVLCLFCFSHGVAVAWSTPAARLPALIEVALSLALIGVLGWQARHYKRKPR